MCISYKAQVYKESQYSGERTFPKQRRNCINNNVVITSSSFSSCNFLRFLFVLFFLLYLPTYLASSSSSVHQSRYLSQYSYQLRLDDKGLIPGRENKLFFAQQHPDRLCGSFSLLFNGHRGWSGRGMNLTTHMCLVPTSGMPELYLHAIPHRHLVMFN